MSILVGMSGGVDSSLSAALLKEMGHDVIGVHNIIWQCNENLNSESCCNLQSSIDAGIVAKQIGIDYKVVDARKLFKDTTIKRMVEDYSKGLVPNPCCLCNATTKIDALYMATNNKNDEIATGHYCRVTEFNGIYYPMKAKNIKKDQSYFLYRLSQELLSKIHFPLGEFEDKLNVREEAQKRNIITAQKPDSQDLCMLPKGGIKDFLMDYAGLFPKSGHIVYNNEIIGTHNGIWGKTIGQRRGYGILSSSKPLFISKIDVATNTIFVDDLENIIKDTCNVSEIVWRGEFINGMEVTINHRYHSKDIKALIYKSDNGFTIKSDSKFIPVPGQSLVCYKGDICLGGGIIY